MPDSEWQEMATAPKDGTSVLVVEDGEYFVAWWQNGAWVRSGDDYNLWVEPTHWWHLPPYPTTPNQTGEVERT